MNRIVVVTAAMLLGCGDGGPGPSGSFTPPVRGGGGTPFAGTGGDRPFAPDRGGGTTPAIGIGAKAPEGGPSGAATATCDRETSCGPGAYCNNQGDGVGHCFVTCKLEAGESIGTSDACPAGWTCVRFSAGTVPVCRLPCTTPDACPGIPPLTTRCSLGYCGWSAAAPS